MSVRKLTHEQAQATVPEGTVLPAGDAPAKRKWYQEQEHAALNQSALPGREQKTAYEMLRSLVGSEMCIRDSGGTHRAPLQRKVGGHHIHIAYPCTCHKTRNSSAVRE